MVHSVDLHVGKRIRHQRLLAGLTQVDLASQIGVRFQQLQKYETGANRVSASRLWMIAKRLDVPVTWFFDGLDSPCELPGDGQGRNILDDKEALNLIRAYYSIPENQRRKIYDLARSLVA